MVSMVAFQAVDPGSIPGHRNDLSVMFLFSCRKKNSIVASNTAYLSSTRMIYRAIFFARHWRYRKPRVPEKKKGLNYYYEVSTRVELVISCLLGRRFNQLSHETFIMLSDKCINTIEITILQIMEITLWKMWKSYQTVANETVSDSLT